MSRDDFQQIRERLFQLTESYSSGQHLPFNNVKRKGGLSRQTSKAGSTSKLSVQDFVRMDPGYTPDIEHLVFPNSRRKSSQQVAPTVTDHHAAAASTSASKPRSRLAEMFALSRHLQKSANERGGGDAKSNKVQINKSVDSAIDPISSSSKTRRQSSMINDSSKKWIYSVDGALHQNNSSTSNKTVSRQNSTATDIES